MPAEEPTVPFRRRSRFRDREERFDELFFSLRHRDGLLELVDRHGLVRREQVAVLHLVDLYAESGQTLQSSFSAVSKPNFASKYSLESSRRDLQNALLCTVLVESVWVKKYTKINIEKMKSGKS